jgi:hypothetical protein
MTIQDTSFVDQSTTVPAAWLNDVNKQIYQGINAVFVTSTGSANAYVITLPSGSRVTSLVSGQEFTFKASFSNTGATTLQVVGASSTTVASILLGGAALVGGEIATGDFVTVAFDGTAYNIQNSSALKKKLALSTGASYVGFIASGTGASAQDAQTKLRETISATAFATLQEALNAAAGKRLYLPAGTYTITADTSISSDTIIEGDGTGTIITTNTGGAGVGQLYANGKSNITIRNVQIASSAFSLVATFTGCTNVSIENTVFQGIQTGGVYTSSIGFRSQGSIGVTLRSCTFYDYDSHVYLDLSGGTHSDRVRVLFCHFEQTVNGNSNNPVGVYQLYCKRLLVDGCTFKDIRANGGSPIAGYSVYEGDGAALSLVVVNCTTIMTVSKAHVMVQNSAATSCCVENNTFYAQTPNYPSATYFNFLYQGGPALGSVKIINNFADGAGIFAQGAGTLATATRSYKICGNQLQNVIQSIGGAIRVGDYLTTYVYRADVTQNSIYRSYGSSVDISQAVYAVVDDNECSNWNTGNNPTDTSPYSMAILWEGAGANSSVGFCRRNRLENNTQVPADTGYPVDGIVVQNATNKVRIGGNDLSSAVTNAYIRATPDSYTYTPTLTNTANLDGSTAFLCQYMRVDNTVTVSGLANIDPTAATTVQLGISLPIASNFGSSQEAAGNGHTQASQNEHFLVYADAVNDRVVLEGVASSTTNHAVWFHFTYQVI